MEIFYHPEKSGTCNFFIEIVNYPDSTYGRDGIDTSRVSTGMPRETVNG